MRVYIKKTSENIHLVVIKQLLTMLTPQATVTFSFSLFFFKKSNFPWTLHGRLINVSARSSPRWMQEISSLKSFLHSLKGITLETFLLN